MQIRTYAALVAAALSIAACNDDSSYDRNVHHGLSLLDRFYPDMENQTQDTVVNSKSGTAVYRGVTAIGWGTPVTSALEGVDRSQTEKEQRRDTRQALGEVVREANVNSDIELNVDFTNNRVSGMLDNFRAPNNDSVAGEIRIHNGIIDQDTGTDGKEVYIHADLSGEITRTGEKHSIDGDLDGEFFGKNGELIAGRLDGHAGAADTNGEARGFEFQGLFGAEMVSKPETK